MSEPESREPGEPGERRPPRGLASRDRPPPPTSRYSILVGIAFAVLVVVAILNSVRTEESGILGADPRERGTPLPHFALPEASGPLEGDANVFQTDCAVAQDPCPPEQVQTPACDVEVGEGEGALRVCDFFDRPLVLSFWFTRFADCLGAQDELDRLARRYRGRAGFLSVNVRDEREAVRSIVAERGWRMPVGHDADGAVSNLYRVGGCPTVLFAYPGGTMAKALIGDSVTRPAMRRQIEALLRRERRRERADR